jgi:membrane-associated protein
MFFDSKEVIDWVVRFSYVGSTIMVFLETGFFFGIVFPGDTLLVALGMLSHDKINIWWIALALILSSVLGYLFGYWQGNKLGHWLEKKEDGFFYTESRMQKAKSLMSKYGVISVLFSKFIPVVRSFGPYIAGIVEMPFMSFFIFNIIGSFLWVGCFLTIGYFAGDIFPHLFEYVLPWAMLFILLIVAWSLYGYIKFRVKRKKR